jgi:PAP2 superfamily
MTTTTSGTSVTDEPIAPITKRWRRGWILEFAAMAGFYWLYESSRGWVAGSTADALANARDLVDAQQWLGINWERSIQQAFINSDWFITLLNWWYGTVHFLIPAGVLVLLYRKMPARFVRWRNTLLAMWAIGVLTFWLYPLAPPRLVAEARIVDTAVTNTNFGPRMKLNFEPKGCLRTNPETCTPAEATLDQYSNPYAAMPSFHVGWSTFSAFAIWPLLRRRWMKGLVFGYLFTVIFCITVTGNHWLLDVPGGWAVVGLGYATAVLLERAISAVRRARARPASAGVGAG